MLHQTELQDSGHPARVKDLELSHSQQQQLTELESHDEEDEPAPAGCSEEHDPHPDGRRFVVLSAATFEAER